MNGDVQHVSVLLNESITALGIKENGIYIDGTFGRGGHSTAILSQLGQAGRLIAIDRDPQAVAVGKMITDERFEIYHASFETLPNLIQQLDLTGKIDGILLDLGVSSPQLDESERGFSFMRDGPLDMRMDPTQGVSAAEWLKRVELDELTQILKTLGEERFSKRIATAIVHRNQTGPVLSTTRELAQLVAEATPKKDKHKHPATRTFQAIRMYINQELPQIERVLASSLAMLAPQGRLAIISFHSLEDRLVKNFIKKFSQVAAVPRGLPLTEAQILEKSSLLLCALGKVKPSLTEQQQNPRSRSAILRVASRAS